MITQSRNNSPEVLLLEFIKTFGGSTDMRLWVKLVEEELKELYAEVPGTKEHLKEFADLIYVHTGLLVVTPDHASYLIPDDELSTINKTLIKAERALKEYLAYYGEEATQEAFNRVHDSNMSKLDDSGKPIKREDGKVLKGPNYKEPDLSDLVKKKAVIREFNKEERNRSKEREEINQ